MSQGPFALLCAAFGDLRAKKLLLKIWRDPFRGRLWITHNVTVQEEGRPALRAGEAGMKGPISQRV